MILTMIFLLKNLIIHKIIINYQLNHQQIHFINNNIDSMYIGS